MPLIRLLLVDDNLGFLDTAALFLRTEPQIEIIGCARDGTAALQLIKAARPDLVLMDWTMPGLNGLETTRLVKMQPDAPCIIIMTLHDYAAYRKAALGARADGFVVKSEFDTQLLPLIRQLFSAWYPSPPNNPSLTDITRLDHTHPLESARQRDEQETSI